MTRSVVVIPPQEDADSLEAKVTVFDPSTNTVTSVCVEVTEYLGGGVITAVPPLLMIEVVGQALAAEYPGAVTMLGFGPDYVSVWCDDVEKWKLICTSGAAFDVALREGTARVQVELVTVIAP